MFYDGYMAQQSIPFQFVANDLALDFVNTRVQTKSGSHDLIATPAQFSSWLQEAGFDCPLDTWSTENYESLFSLREALTAATKAATEGVDLDPEAMNEINVHLINYRSRHRISKNDHGFHLKAEKSPLMPAELMGLLAHAAATVLVETDLKRLKKCANSECVLVFKDTSKSGRRRWCSMDTCGNRAKVATFRAGGDGS